MIERALGATHQVVCVRAAGDALAALQYSEPFDVVISDFDMPGMDGVSLLVQVARLDPLVTRLLISGHADLDDAAKAINEGHIFSFLRKPFTVPALRMVVERAVEQHRLQATERDLLRDTLHGAVNALSGLLALSCPSAYGRGVRLQRHAADLAAAVQAHDRWAIDLLLCDVAVGMVFAENVSMPNGIMLVARGQDVTRALLARINGPWEEFARNHSVRMVAAAE